MDVCVWCVHTKLSLFVECTLCLFSYTFEELTEKWYESDHIKQQQQQQQQQRQKQVSTGKGRGAAGDDAAGADTAAGMVIGRLSPYPRRS